MTVDGQPVPGNLLALHDDGEVHQVQIALKNSGSRVTPVCICRHVRRPHGAASAMRDRQRGKIHGSSTPSRSGTCACVAAADASASHPYLPLTIIAIPKRRVGPQIIGMLDMWVKNADNGIGPIIGEGHHETRKTQGRSRYHHRFAAGLRGGYPVGRVSWDRVQSPRICRPRSHLMRLPLHSDRRQRERR